MLITDAVCVKFLSKDEIIVGLGNQLQYFYQKHGTTVRKICPFRTRDKIKDLKHVRVKENEYTILGMSGRVLLLANVQENEFTQSFTLHMNDWISSILFGATPDQIFLVTSHNRACHISINYDQQSASVMKKSRCEDYSTAYASLIYGHLWEKLLFFAGTAFGELILWQPYPNSELGTIILRIENAHNGVIFNIDLSLNHNLLTTTSDDRSIQLWKILGNADGYQIERIKRCFAHTARVFYSKIIHKDGKVYIVSIGEDSKICIWNNQGALLNKKSIGTGGALWGLDYSVDLEMAIATASNGQIIQIPLKNLFHNEMENDKKIIHFPNFYTKEHITKVKYLESAELLLGLSTHNRLVYMKHGETDSNEISLPRDHKYCILRTHKDFVYLATTDSKIFIYQHSLDAGLLKPKNEVQLKWDASGQECSNSMIRALLPVGTNSLVACNNLGEFHIIDDTTFEMSAQFQLSKCPEPWITFALHVDNIFLIGDRCGNLHLFKNGHQAPVFTLKRLHGNLGITLIQELDTNVFKTAGHDGCFKTIVVEEDTLRCIRTEKLYVNWIEKHINNLTFGFNDSHFICYGNDGGVLYEQDCGGGHRQWDLLWNKADNRFSVVFIQHKEVIQIDVNLSNSVTNHLNFPDVRWHHNSCNTLKALTCNGKKLLISGGEDTMLKFFEIRKNNENLSTLLPIATSYQHISSVKAFITINLANSDILLVSVGGRAQICITRLVTSKLRIEEELSYMLFQTDAVRKREGTAQSVLYDPETRITSITHATQDKDYLVCGCSDGFIRVFEIFLNQKPVKLVLEKEFFYGRCLLHVHSIKIMDQIVVISVGTDGVINFWNFQDMTDPVYKLKHHESGVHAFDLHQNGGEILLATGGDDQSVVYSELITQTKNSAISFSLKRSIPIRNLHTAQVTGVRILDKGLSILSTGVDQMIYRYKLTSTGATRIEKEIWTSVADVKGLVFFDDSTIVYGNGVEIIN